MLPQGTGRNAYQIEDIAILADQRTIRFFRLRRRLPDKTAQTVRYKIGQPCAAESIMGLQPPHGKFPNVQLYVLERIEQTGKIPILESGNILKFAAVLQNPRLGEHLIDPVHPFLQIPAAALQDQAVFAFHAPQVIGCDRIDIQKIASYRSC